MYSFTSVPVDYRTHIIVDIKSLKFKKNARTEIKDYAWTIFPIFNTIEDENESDDKPFYVRSGSYIMPLYLGSIRGDIVKELQAQTDPWIYLKEQAKKKVTSVNNLTNSSVLVKCIDNQRSEGYDAEIDFKQINYSFCPEKLGAYELKENKMKKGTLVKNLISSDKNSEKLTEEIGALLRTTYKIPI